MSLGLGEEFAGFAIVGRLGSGGMGEVYLAQHPRLPRRDALKVLSAELPNDPSYRERFLREADAAAKLWHPHIVGVHDRGEYDGRLWISMDFVDGEDAGSLLHRRYPAGMPAELAIAIVTAVGSALDYAHRQGLLHRDVKPANIMLANVDDPAERRIMLTDFGIARDINDRTGLTQTNMTVGTVAYCSPEQLMGGNIDGRADQYALAATAYHLLTGTTLFPLTNPGVVIGSHLNADPPRLSDAPPDLAVLDPVFAMALAKEPGQRFGSCSDFARALAEQADSVGATEASAPTAFGPAAPRGPATPPPSPPTPPPGPAAVTMHAGPAQSSRMGQPALIVIGLLALALAGVIGYLLSSNDGNDPAPQATPTTPAQAPLMTITSSAPGTVTETATHTVAKPPETVTIAPPTVRPVPPPVQVPAPSRSVGDLGLSIPMSHPLCDGMGIVIVYSATKPETYRLAVQQALSSHPGSSYLRTDMSCPSLRQSSDDGTPIYAVFYPAGYSKGSVCSTVAQIGPGAYGRWLSTDISPAHKIAC